VSELAQDAGPTGRGYAVAVLKPNGAGVITWIFTFSRLSRAGAKPRPDGHCGQGVEIPPGVANEEGTCRPAGRAALYGLPNKALSIPCKGRQ